MKKRFLLVFFALFFTASIAFAESSPMIRVLVVNQQRSSIVTAKSGKLFVKTQSGVDIATFLPDEKHVLVAEAGKIKIDGKVIDSTFIIIKPETKTDVIKVNNRWYKGTFSIKLLPDGKSLNAINLLPVEEYLYSAVANELMPLWPVEAAKAQAIVSRSIAFYAIEENKFKDFDIFAVASQFYTGIDVERDEAKSAVDNTYGQVLFFNNDPVKPYFHASSGGRTEAVDGISYLQSVVDYDNDSPDFSWEKLYTAEQIDKLLKTGGYDNIGKLQGFEFSPFDIAKLASLPDRGKSGRIKQLKVLGDKGFAIISGEKFSKMLSLPSSAFDLGIGNLFPESIEVPITDAYGNVIGVKTIPITVKDKFVFSTDRPFVQRVTWSENEKIIIKGRGRGSGIGFSQWGARGLALKNNSCEEILRYYFSGTKVKKIY